MATDLDRDVRTDEEQRAIAERVRDRHRHHEARKHDREHEETDRHRIGIEHVRHPGRVVPRPPDDEQDEQRPPRSLPREVVEQQMRDLRDSEHEDEVVEQLEVRGVLLLVALAEESAHRAATLAIRPTGPAVQPPEHGLPASVLPRPDPEHRNVRLPLDNRCKTEDALRMEMKDGVEEQPEEIAADPRECRFELPPLDGHPFADAREKAQAVRRIVEQAERERASAP